MDDSDKKPSSKADRKVGEVFAEPEAAVQILVGTDTESSSSSPSQETQSLSESQSLRDRSTIPKAGSYSLKNINLDDVEFESGSSSSGNEDNNERKGNDSRGAELVGKLIDNKYQIVALIGSGGMSNVYKIKHLLLNRTLALKMVHPHLLADKESLARFRREAEATSRLDHPNIVKVWEFGITPDNCPYIIMDLIEGKSLSQEIKANQNLSPERVVHIISQACAALSHAHGRNIVHRDIKPSNIMLCKNENDDDFVKVVDFGIAQVVAEDTELAKLTQTGQIFGTPMYMSPEQCQGQQLDARADIYSLGCVMYESLAGAPPFQGSTVYEMIFKQMNEAPAGLGTSVKNRALRDSLETIIFRSIAKNAQDRYQSMIELKDDLSHVNEAPARGPLGLLESFVRQWYFRQLSRNLRPMVRQLPLIATSVLLVSGGLFFATQMGALNPPSEKLWKNQDKEGQAQFDRGQKKEALASFQHELEVAKKLENPGLIIASLDELQDIETALGDTQKAAQIKAEIKAMDKSEVALSAESALDAEISKLKGKLTDPDAIKRLDEICNSAMDETMTLATAGKVKEARAMLAKIRKIVDEALPAKDPLIARCFHNEAYLEHLESKYDAAEALYIKALDVGADKAVLAPDSPYRARTMTGLASIYTQLGIHLDKAESLLIDADGINHRAFGPNSEQVASSSYNIAALYNQLGRKKEATEKINKVISMFNYLGAEKHAVALGKAYDMLGRIKQDKSLSEKALSMFEAPAIKEYQSLCRVLIQLANISSLDDPAQAQAYLDRAKAIVPRFSKTDQELLEIDILQAQSLIYEKTKKYDLAEANLRDVLKKVSAAQESKNGKDTIPVSMLSWQARLADILAAKKDYGQAEKIYKEIFNVIETRHGAKEALGMKPYWGYVRILKAQNREAEAQSVIDRYNKIH